MGNDLSRSCKADDFFGGDTTTGALFVAWALFCSSRTAGGSMSIEAGVCGDDDGAEEDEEAGEEKPGSDSGTLSDVDVDDVRLW
jgi:hypothetical protein